MDQRRRAQTAAFTCSVLVGAALAGSTPAAADPTDPATTPSPAVIYPTDAPPPPPPPVSSNPMTPRQPPVPAAPAAPPVPAAPGAPPAPAPAPGQAPAAPADPGAPPPPVFQPSVPEIPNAQYGNGNGSGGIFGSIIDLWNQAKNPSLDPSGTMGPGGGVPAVPAGAGPAPALPPGYVSTNSPGSETPASSNGPAGPATGRPSLPPGYYPIGGPPPPWYLDPAAAAPAPAPAPGS